MLRNLTIVDYFFNYTFGNANVLFPKFLDNIKLKIDSG